MHLRIQGSNHTTIQRDPVTAARCINITGSGLHAIPDAIVPAMADAQELHAGHNQLQAIGLRTIADLSALRVLRLPGNGFAQFPGALLAMRALRVLDLGDNRIEALPTEMWRLDG